MGNERRINCPDLDPEWVNKLHSVDIDPDDIKKVVLDYLFTNNMSEIARIFMKESGMDPTRVSHSNREIMESFLSDLHNHSYVSLLEKLAELIFLDDTKKAKLIRLSKGVIFRLHQLVTLQKIQAEIDPEDIIEYARLHLRSEDTSDVDRVLLVLINKDRDDSLESEIVSKLSPELTELLSLHFDLQEESRLTYLLKQHAHINMSQS